MTRPPPPVFVKRWHGVRNLAARGRRLTQPCPQGYDRCLDRSRPAIYRHGRSRTFAISPTGWAAMSRRPVEVLVEDAVVLDGARTFLQIGPMTAIAPIR